jgi:hypothetical protein
MAMFGNGAAINGTIIIVAHRLMEVLGKLVNQNTGSGAVVRGTSIRGSAVRPFATGIDRRTASTSSVFGLLVLPRGLPSTLLFYSFTLLLFSFFSFPFLPQAARFFLGKMGVFGIALDAETGFFT